MFVRRNILFCINLFPFQCMVDDGTTTGDELPMIFKIRESLSQKDNFCVTTFLNPKRIFEFSKESGLSLNPTKCEVNICNASPDKNAERFVQLNVLLPGMKLLNECTLELLGRSIFENGGSKALGSTLEVVKLLYSRLSLVNVHPAPTILRNSISSPKFEYLLRIPARLS